MRRRKGGDRTGREAQGRRRFPPAATGQEAEFLQAVKEAHSPMVVRLTDGRDVRGVVEYFDSVMVKITRPSGPHVFVRKTDIRYMYEDPEQ